MTVRHKMISRAPHIAAFRFFVSITLFLAATFWLSSADALTQPKWAELSSPHQIALKPLAGEWDKLDDLRRRKWIAVAERYPSMKPEQQKRIQARMGDWARLTPTQRNQARETFRKTQAVPAAQKKAEWQQYQTLPDAQKRRLAIAADASKPARQKARQREIEGKVVKPGQTGNAKPAAGAPRPAVPTVPTVPTVPAAAAPTPPAIPAPPAAPAPPVAPALPVAPASPVAPAPPVAP